MATFLGCSSEGEEGCESGSGEEREEMHVEFEDDALICAGRNLRCG